MYKEGAGGWKHHIYMTYAVLITFMHWVHYMPHLCLSPSVLSLHKQYSLPFTAQRRRAKDRLRKAHKLSLETVEARGNYLCLPINPVLHCIHNTHIFTFFSLLLTPLLLHPFTPGEPYSFLHFSCKEPPMSLIHLCLASPKTSRLLSKGRF